MIYFYWIYYLCIGLPFWKLSVWHLSMLFLCDKYVSSYPNLQRVNSLKFLARSSTSWAQNWTRICQEEVRVVRKFQMRGGEERMLNLNEYIFFQPVLYCISRTYETLNALSRRERSDLTLRLLWLLSVSVFKASLIVFHTMYIITFVAASSIRFFQRLAGCIQRN